MATYLITSPDGRKFRVSGEGTKEEALAHFQAQLAQPSPSAPLDPSEYDPNSQAWQEKYGATSTMGAGEKLMAGAGKAVTDVGRGLGQLGAGIADFVNPQDGMSRVDEKRQQVQDSRELDSSLMDTGMGKVGNLAGNLAMFLPTMAIPGANTVTGAALTGSAAGLLQPSTSTGETLMNIGLGGTAGAAGQYGGQKLAGYVGNKLAARQGAAEVARDANVVRDATLKEGLDAGYAVPPATTNPTAVNRALEGAAGKITTAQSAAIKNQGVTNKLAAKAIGLADDAPVTKAALEGVRKEAGTVYAGIADTGEVALDSKFAEELTQLPAQVKKMLAVKGTDHLDWSKGGTRTRSYQNMNAGKLVQDLKELRFQSQRNLSPLAAQNPESAALGRAQKKAANAVESLLMRHLKTSGRQDLADQFAAARTLIAKTHSVEKALNESTGNVSATKLASQLAKGKPLSGELKTAAKFAQAFPKAAREVNESMPGVSPLDYFAAVGLGSMNPAGFLYPAARPAIRSALTGNMGRRMAVPKYDPSKLGTLALQSAGGLGRIGAPLTLSVEAMQ